MDWTGCVLNTILSAAYFKIYCTIHFVRTSTQKLFSMVQLVPEIKIIISLLAFIAAKVSGAVDMEIFNPNIER